MDDLAYIDGILYNYTRKALDNNGFTGIPVYKSKEADNTTIPFVKLRYTTLPLPFQQPTSPKNPTFTSFSRAILSVMVIGDDVGSNRTVAQNIGSLLYRFYYEAKSQVDKIGHSRIALGLNSDENDKTQSYEVTFQAEVIVVNTQP